MKFLTIDFETYYDSEYSLKKMSTSAYIYDAMFEVIGVAVKNGSDPAIWMEEYQFRVFAKAADWSKIGILCHHAHFDGLILAHYYNVKPMFWFDTLSMSRALSGPHAGHSLEELAIRYKAGTKGRELENTLSKRRKDFTLEQFIAFGAYGCNDDELTFCIFQKMMERGFHHNELEIIDRVVRMFTEPALVLDEDKMRDYLIYEIKKKQELLEKTGTSREDLLSNDKFSELLRQFDIDPPTKFGKPNKDGSPEQIYAFAKTDPGFKDLLESDNDEIRWLAETRVSIKSTGNETRAGRFLSMGQSRRPMPVYYNYAKAHTHRLAGGDGCNWANLERTSKKDPMKGMIRQSIMAPKGYKIVAADSSQIEARKTAWLAQYTKLVDEFASGIDVYSRFASDAFGRKIDRKKVAEDEVPGHIGKCMVLGLGYGMGFIKFASEMLKGMNGGPVVQFTEADIEKLKINPVPFLSYSKNIDRVKEMPSRLPLKERLIHCCVAKHFVDTYRKDNKPIPALWEFHERILDMMLAGRETVFHHLGFLQLEKDGVRGPNGLKLLYPGLRKTDDGYEYFNGHHTTKIYGGLFTENLVQWLCRTIVMEQLRKLAKKYHVVMTTYDEIVMVVPDGQAEECLQETIEVMTAPVDWAEGLPLAAEGGIGDTYAEAK